MPNSSISAVTIVTTSTCDSRSTIFRVALVAVYPPTSSLVPPNRCFAAQSSRAAAVPSSSPPSRVDRRLPLVATAGQATPTLARPALGGRACRFCACPSPDHRCSLLLCSQQQAVCACDQHCHRSLPPPFPARPQHSRAATCDPACPSWSTITLGLPTLCCSPSTLRPLGLPTPRPFRRLALRPPLLGPRPRKLQVGCAPALPADAVGVPRSNVSTMASAPHAGRVSMEGRSASTLRLQPSDRGDEKVAPLAEPTNNQTQIADRSRAKVYNHNMGLRLGWVLSKAHVPCWMHSIHAF